MSRVPAVLLLLHACSCASSPPGEPAPAALAGEEARFDTWRAFVVQDGKLYPHPQVAAVQRLLDEMMAGIDAFGESGAVRQETKRIGSEFAKVLTAMLGQVHGDPYGGPDRLTLGLFRLDGDDRAKEAVFLEFTALKPGETERTMKAADVFGAYHRPVSKVRARLESGRVRLRRIGPGRAEFHVAAIFRVPDSDERLHLITRVEAPVHVGRR